MSTYKEIESRRNKIYEIILKQDSISVEKLSSLLGISKMTVQRDLNVIEKRGGIQRLHGGVSIKICELDGVDQIITDEGVDKTQRVNLENMGIEVLIATKTA